MRDLRGRLPLTDADFARIRANVMASVRPKRTVFAFRWAFAMLAAAFAGVISHKSLQVTPSIPTATAPRITVTVPLRHPERSAGPQPLQRLAEEIAPPRKAAARRPPTNRPTNQPTNPLPLRMEIQTSDPDIRIIWLPNQYDPKSEESS